MLLSESLLSSESFRTAVLGLLIGELGGLAVPGRRAFALSSAATLGVGGAFVGGFLGGMVVGAQFSGVRLALAGMVSALLVCCWTLYLRERRLPR